MSESKEALIQKKISVETEAINCDVIVVFRKYPESWKEVMFDPQQQKLIRDDIFLKKKFRLGLGVKKEDSIQPINKYDFYIQMEKDFKSILTDTCRLDVQLQEDEGIDYLKITASETVLRGEAHEQGYKLRMQMERDANEFASECPPYAPFDENYFQEDLFQKQQDGTIWRQVDRIRLIYGEIEDHLGIPQAAKHYLCEFFIPHDPDIQFEMHKVWMKWDPRVRPPIASIRNYFGEQVALYFLWTDTLVYWLRWPSLIGLIFFIVGASIAGAGTSYTDDQDKQDVKSSIDIIFACFLVLWAVLFTEYWKRKQGKQVLEWGTDDYENREQVRAEFKGVMRKSRVTGKYEKTFEISTRRRRKCCSLAGSGFYIVLAAAAAIWLMILKGIYKNDKASVQVIGFSISIQIKIMNYIFIYIAEWMTDWENYRTATEYEDSLQGKIFGFQFINSFVSLFYIAFIKPFTSEECDQDNFNGSCTEEIFTQLLIMFAMFIAFNAIELALPLIQKHRAKKKAEAGASYSRLEYEASMKQSGVQGDYLELIICFGYITLFVFTFPLAPLFGLLAVIIEIKVDGYKYLWLTQRSYPEGAADIGIWQSVLEFIVVCQIVSNCALAFVTDQWDKLKNNNSDYQDYGYLLFIGISFTLLVIVNIMREAVPDETDWVRDMKARHKIVIKQKYFKKKKGLDESHYEE